MLATSTLDCKRFYGDVMFPFQLTLFDAPINLGVNTHNLDGHPNREEYQMSIEGKEILLQNRMTVKDLGWPGWVENSLTLDPGTSKGLELTVVHTNDPPRMLKPVLAHVQCHEAK